LFLSLSLVVPLVASPSPHQPQIPRSGYLCRRPHEEARRPGFSPRTTSSPLGSRIPHVVPRFCSRVEATVAACRRNSPARRGGSVEAEEVSSSSSTHHHTPLYLIRPHHRRRHTAPGSCESPPFPPLPTPDLASPQSWSPAR
jgi:hypothetical protein